MVELARLQKPGKRPSEYSKTKVPVDLSCLGKVVEWRAEKGESLLERIRNSQQTLDLDKINATCYDPQATMDFSQSRRGITLRNPHRWDLTLYAALEYGKEHGKKSVPLPLRIPLDDLGPERGRTNTSDWKWRMDLNLQPYGLYQILTSRNIWLVKAYPSFSTRLVASFSNPKRCEAWGYAICLQTRSCWEQSWFRYLRTSMGSIYARACTEGLAFKWGCRDEACLVSPVLCWRTTSRSHGRWEGYC